jgi:hypothetical protein
MITLENSVLPLPCALACHGTPRCQYTTAVTAVAKLDSKTKRNCQWAPWKEQNNHD